MALRNRPLRNVAIAAGILLLIALPFIFPSPYYRHIMIMSAVFVVLAMGLNLVFGYAGQLAFGYTAFFALGAYGTTLMAIHLPLPFWLNIAGGTVFAAFIAFLLGYPCLRLRGPYFAIATFAFAEIIRLIANNWIEVTNGPMGLSITSIPRLEIPPLFSVSLKNDAAFYYVALAIACFAIYAKMRLIDSRFGRAIIGLRQNEDLAASIGIHPFAFKMRAWVIGAALAGLAGGTYAVYLRIIDPLLFAIYYTFLVFSMVIIGGAGTIVGPIVGGVLFTVLPETLRLAQSYRMILFTLLLLLFILFLPKGLAGLVEMATRRVRRTSAAENS